MARSEPDPNLCDSCLASSGSRGYRIWTWTFFSSRSVTTPEIRNPVPGPLATAKYTGQFCLSVRLPQSSVQEDPICLKALQ